MQQKSCWRAFSERRSQSWVQKESSLLFPGFLLPWGCGEQVVLGGGAARISKLLRSGEKLDSELVVKIHTHMSLPSGVSRRLFNLKHVKSTFINVRDCEICHLACSMKGSSNIFREE